MVTLDVQGKGVCSLLDSESMVTLIWEAYFEKNIVPLLKASSGEFSEAHSLFKLSAANNSVMPVSKYFEADINILGFAVPCIGFLMAKDPNTLLEPQHLTQLPGVIGCNLIWLGCEEFGRVYGFDPFKKFQCPQGIHPVVFAQICSFYHQEKLQKQTESNSQGQSNVSSLGINLSSDSDTTLGQVWVGDSHQLICIPANSGKVVSGRTNKITKCLMCMIESMSNNNLPMGVVVNRTIVTPNKSKHIPLILMNTNSYNIWICQSLLAADVLEADHCLWDYQSSLSHKGNEVKVTFHPVPFSEVQEEILSASVSNSAQSNSDSEEQGKRLKFGP